MVMAGLTPSTSTHPIGTTVAAKAATTWCRESVHLDPRVIPSLVYLSSPASRRHPDRSCADGCRSAQACPPGHRHRQRDRHLPAVRLAGCRGPRSRLHGHQPRGRRRLALRRRPGDGGADPSRRGAGDAVSVQGRRRAGADVVREVWQTTPRRDQGASAVTVRETTRGTRHVTYTLTCARCLTACFGVIIA